MYNVHKASVPTGITDTSKEIVFLKTRLINNIIV
uniref:Uncharacterized protein n=1 Tax=Heterorhabditis bacteriophora TaxID=37862 RepID=A0A1I7WZ60_HETBA